MQQLGGNACGRDGVVAVEQRLEATELELRNAERRLEQLRQTIPEALLVLDATGRVVQANEAASQMLGFSAEQLLALDFAQLCSGRSIAPCGASEQQWIKEDGSEIPMLVSIRALADEQQAGGFICIGTDLRERKALEMRLRHAQKLEAVGVLAAGVAHEINTPMQFVADTVSFLREAHEDLWGLVAPLRALREAADGKLDARLLATVDDALEQADLAYLDEHVPRGFERVSEGITRVTKIVAALKYFSHIERQPLAVCDLNESVRNVLIVAKNEYKYVADVQTDLGQLPELPCRGGDINQVLLNLVVNAAHAIGARYGDSGQRGTISIRTSAQSDAVVVSISDDGGGIPDEIRERVFDPFFTTKAIGKGTGQGLALAHSIVVEAHGGALSFETERGVGTTFTMKLPISPHEEDARLSGEEQSDRGADP